MKLNNSSWYVWIYRSSYGIEKYQLPKNLCPFFWKLLLSFVLLPFVFFGHLCNIKRIELNGIAIGSLIQVLMLLITGVTFSDYFHAHYWTWILFFKCYGLAFLFITGFVIGIVIIILLLTYIQFIIKYIKTNRKPKKIKTYQQKEPSIITSFIKAKYNKYCPSIEWTK